MLTLFKNKKLVLVSSIYLVTMFLFLYMFGVNTSGDARRFIRVANEIVNGDIIENKTFSFFYISYSLFVAFFIKFSIFFFVLGIVQILLSIIAAYHIYKFIICKFNNEVFAFSFFTLYLFCYPIQKWVLFVFSEGIHTSLVVIGVYYFFQLLEKVNLKNSIIFFILLCLILTSRPVGIIFFLSALLTFILYLWTTNKRRIAYFFIVGILGCLVIVLNSPLRYFVNPDSLRRMEVICLVPQNGDTSTYTEYNKTGLIGAYKVVKNEIGFTNFLKIGFSKLKLFFGIVRPYFSFKNNLFLSLYWLLYPLAIIGIFRYKKKEYSLFVFFSVCYILITACGIFVTCVDWHDRFIASVFPFIIILFCIGLDWFRSKLIDKKFKLPWFNIIY